MTWLHRTNPSLPCSPPASPHTATTSLEPEVKIEAFDPTNNSLNDENAVVISVDDITPYLDAALKVLGLHIEARTSFITYVLFHEILHMDN